MWLTRQSLEAGAKVFKPGCGWMPPSWLPEDGVRRALRALARDPQAPLADYASPLGLPALRQQLAWRLAQHGVEAPPEQIVLTDAGLAEAAEVERIAFAGLFATEDRQIGMDSFVENGPGKATFVGR